MNGRAVFLQRLAACVAALALTVAFADHARATPIAYGFAEQTISDLTIVPGTGTLSAASAVTTGTTDSATQNASGISRADPLDALQSYLGTPPPPPQNYFVKYAAFPGAPPIPSGTAPNGLTTGGGTLDSFTRGDVLITGVTSTSSSSVVAESFLKGAPGHESGSGALSATVTIRPSDTTKLTIAYNFANDAYVMTSAGGGAQAQYHFDITIKDSTGALVFSSSTADTNLSLGSPPNGDEILRSGTETVTTTTLTGGADYTVIFSSSAATFVATENVIPEPSTVVMASSAVLIGLFWTRHRRRPATR